MTSLLKEAYTYINSRQKLPLIQDVEFVGVTNGGEGGIRTLETLLTPTRVPGVRFQPLTHLSESGKVNIIKCLGLSRGKYKSIKDKIEEMKNLTSLDMLSSDKKPSDCSFNSSIFLRIDFF